MSRPNGVFYGSANVEALVLAAVRILIASFFLARGSGLIKLPGDYQLFGAVLPEAQAVMATTVLLFGTGFLIMVGRAVRPAALLLAVFVFWSGFLHHDIASDPQALSGFWRDMALLGAVMLIAMTEPGGSERFQFFVRQVVPRRVRRTAEGTARRADAADAQVRFASTRRRAAVAPDDMQPPEGEEDVVNLFADLQDEPVKTT